MDVLDRIARFEQHRFLWKLDDVQMWRECSQVLGREGSQEQVRGMGLRHAALLRLTGAQSLFQPPASDTLASDASTLAGPSDNGNGRSSAALPSPLLCSFCPRVALVIL